MFRPSFELLEKREVLSADLIGGLELGYQCGGSEGKPIVRFGIAPAIVGSEVAGSDREASLLSCDFNNDGHLQFQGGVTVAAGDVSGDRLTDQQPHHFYGSGVYRAINWGDGHPLPFALADGSVRFQKQIVSFIEQDNLYKSSDSFRDAIFGNEAFVNALYLDLLDRNPDAETRDQVFAKLEMERNSLSVDSTLQKNLGGMLLAVKQSPKGITVDPRDHGTVYGALASNLEKLGGRFG